MDLSVIFDAIIPDNIRNLPLVKKCSEVFIEQLNRNSAISRRISKLYDIDSTTWVKRDSNGNITEVDDSEFVNNAKKILKMGLLYTYLNFIFTHVSKIQKNSSVISDIRENQYNSPLYNNVYDFLNSEYLGGLRYYQQCAGTEQAIKYMYAFAKYLETGILTYDLVLEKMGVFNLAYSGSLNKDMFIGFNKNISHPCGWLCEYEKIIIEEPDIIADTVLLDATFENEFIDLIGNYTIIYDSSRYNYDTNGFVEYSKWIEENLQLKYSDGIDGKCIEFTDIEYNDYTPDFTEYPPIEYPEKFKQVAEIYSANLEGQYIGTYDISGKTYYEKKISVSDTNYDVILLKIPNNYNGISSRGYGHYSGDTEIDPYAKIQYDDGRLTTVIDPEKFSLGRNAGYESSADDLKFYFSLNDNNIIPTELKFTFSIRPKFIKNPSEFITYLNNRNYSCPNYWTFFVYNNNAFQYYSNKTITENDFFFTSVVANDYPSNYLYHTIGGYYLKARMYLTYNLRNSKQFGYYLVINNESINDGWNCRDALENTANGIDFKSDYTVIDLTEKGLNEEWIDIEVIVTHFDTTLNVDNNSYTFEVYNQYSNIVFVELFPNIENLKNNDEHVLLFYEQIADFKLYLKPKVEEVLISDLLTENDLNRELTYYEDYGDYGYTSLTDDVVENGTGYINSEYAEAVKENGRSRHSINHFVDPFELVNENGYIIAKPGNIITDIGGSGETNYWFYYASVLNVFDNRNFAKIDFDIKFIYDREKYISHMMSTTATYQDYLNNSIILQNNQISGEDPVNVEHNRFSEYYNGWYDDPGIVIGGTTLNLKVFYDISNQELHAWFVFTDSSNTKKYIDISECFNSGEWTHVTYINNNQNCALHIGDNSVNFRDTVNNRCIVKAYCEYDTIYGNDKDIYDMYWYMQTANIRQYYLKELEQYSSPSLNIVDCGYTRNEYILSSEVYNEDPLGYSLLWNNGEITHDIIIKNVNQTEQELYTLKATNREGSNTSWCYVPSSLCGANRYKLGFESKENYDLNKWKLEFDFFNTVNDLRKRPMIVVCGYILEEQIDEWNTRTAIECISIGANKTSRQFFENDYPFEDMYELNLEEYNNHIDKWCHCILEVDNSLKTVSVKIDDIEVYNETLQINFNPLKVFFYSYNNGYNGCSYGYKIDNLKIASINN